MPERRIYVESEFAPLKTVVLSQSEFRGSDADYMSLEEHEKHVGFLPEDERKRYLELLGKDHADAFPERHQQWLSERQNFRQVLEKYGVEVLMPNLLSEWQKKQAGKAGYMNAYVRDPWFTIADFVIEGSLRSPYRRLEVLPNREIFQNEVIPSACSYIAVPQPDPLPTEIDNGGIGPFLEGGDVLVYHKHIFVGCSGRTSSPAGIEWLRKLLAPHGFTVEMIPLQAHVLHLDCALGLIREGLMLVQEESLINGIPDCLKDWKKIPVSKDEAMRLATNGLPIRPDVYVTDPQFEQIGSAIARHGIQVEYVDFTISRSYGGSFRCTSQPLWRE